MTKKEMRLKALIKGIDDFDKIESIPGFLPDKKSLDSIHINKKAKSNTNKEVKKYGKSKDL